MSLCLQHGTNGGLNKHHCRCASCRGVGDSRVAEKGSVHLLPVTSMESLIARRLRELAAVTCKSLLWRGHWLADASRGVSHSAEGHTAEHSSTRQVPAVPAVPEHG